VGNVGYKVIKTYFWGFFISYSFRLIEERGFFLIAWNGCAYAYPPPFGFLCEGFWRWVGVSTVFHEGSVS
jgi:hypothetical protein